jgi:O-antigen/teichoic acid export membrane protein
MSLSAMSLLRRTRDRLRLQDLEILTPEARSQERYKRVGLTAVASMGARAVAFAVTFVTVPLTLRYLGTEQYGLWATMTSATALLGFADFGLSNGLVNGVSDALGGNDRETVRRYVSSVFYMLVVVMLILGIAFAATYGLVPWAELFNVSSAHAAAVAGPAMAVFLAVTIVALPLSVVQSVRAGFQEGFASSVWQGVGSIVSLVGLVVAIAANAKLPWLVLALGGGPVIALLLNGAVLLRSRPWLAPRLRLATLPAVRRMMRFGLMFFILAIAISVAYQTDNIVIARMLGPAQVTQYAVPMKLFMVAPLILSFGLMPLWPAYGEAIARRDVAWVRRTLIRSLAISATLGALMSAVLLAFGVAILHAWAGNSIHPTTPLVLALSAWALVQCVTGCIAMYLNGANALGFQAVCATIMMVANLGLSIALTRAIGISGPAWGSVIAQMLFVLLPCSVYVPTTLKRLSERGLVDSATTGNMFLAREGE